MQVITPTQVIKKIEEHGSESLTYVERVFVVEVFRAAAFTDRQEVHEVKQLIQKAHLEYCLRLSSKKGKDR